MVKKTVFTLFVFLLLLCGPFVYSAAGYTGSSVDIRVEGPDHTLARATVKANTFREAAEALATEWGWVLTYVQSGETSNLYGIDGPADENGETAVSGGIGEWLGFVIRSEQIVKQEDYLNMALSNGDELVLYQGDPAETLIVTQFACEAGTDALHFFIGVDETEWVEEDGVWTPLTYVRPVEGASIHVTLPGGLQTVQTDAEGRASVATPDVGAATYYADGIRQDAAPLIVRTTPRVVACGFDPSAPYITRAQAVAFLVGMYAVEGEQPEVLPFSDVDEQTAYYTAIAIATGKELIVGYEDGTFRPDAPADLMQVCVLTARLFPSLLDETAAVEGLPEWAASAAGGIYQAGFLEGIDPLWENPVTPETLVLLYLNITA